MRSQEREAAADRLPLLVPLTVTAVIKTPAMGGITIFPEWRDDDLTIVATLSTQIDFEDEIERGINEEILT